MRGWCGGGFGSGGGGGFGGRGGGGGAFGGHCFFGGGLDGYGMERKGNGDVFGLDKVVTLGCQELKWRKRFRHLAFHSSTIKPNPTSPTTNHPKTKNQKKQWSVPPP